MYKQITPVTDWFFVSRDKIHNDGYLVYQIAAWGLTEDGNCVGLIGDVTGGGDVPLGPHHLQSVKLICVPPIAGSYKHMTALSPAEMRCWVFGHPQPGIFTLGKLQWLILEDENEFELSFTNDSSDENDVAGFVNMVNGEVELNEGYSDWRVPTADELKLSQDYLGGLRVPYWSSSIPEGGDPGLKLSVNCHGVVSSVPPDSTLRVRLVRDLNPSARAV